MNEFIPAARPIIGDEERLAVDAVLRSGQIAQGPVVADFEQEFSEALLDGRDVVAVNSGTAGLHLGLLAAGIGPGDEVIVPSFTFAATANSVALTGATPVFADIDAETYTLNPASVQEMLSARTKGIMPVHLYGHPADLPALALIADQQGVSIFEDAAQAHGAEIAGKRVGTFGEFAMFSLYPTKNMTSGEGGMISCGNAGVARNARLLRNQGMERQYENETIGFNARMTDLHAAIGREQLKKLPTWNEQRRSNAAFLSEHLKGVSVPLVRENAVHVFHQYTIRVLEDRDGFAAALREEYLIGSGVYYPIPNHELPSLRQFAKDADLPNTKQAASEALSLPVHPSLTERDLERIVTAVNTLAKAGA
ncbi:MAG: DegT/DnrJ/EryC1/StrS family aminotransferase [Aeromicrobium sp.]|nr:MAG: DegT/DnrJ/EryC1/StrS family aminotransferase [Aeromicrobium sp.]